MNQKKISLALSSGGARGFSHIGVIEKLLDKEAADVSPEKTQKSKETPKLCRSYNYNLIC